MKGAIFNLFEQYVQETCGGEAYERILDGSVLVTVEPFVGPGTYPPGDLLAMVTTACGQLGTEPDVLVRSFGRWSFAHLAASVPQYMEQFGDALGFLRGFESVIHSEVRKLDPDAQPPRFDLEERPDGRLLLHYTSPLRLFAMASGLLEGCGDHFDDPFDHTLLEETAGGAVFELFFPVSAP